MADARYHVRFRDDEANEELGLILTESPQLGFTKRAVNPYAAKGATGDTQDSDLTEWSVLSFRDWRGGRGQEQLVDKAMFLDSWNLESRIEGQLTLGPLPQNPVEVLPRHEMTDVTGDTDYIVLGYRAGSKREIGDGRTWRFGWGGGKIALRIVISEGGFDARIESIEVRMKRDAGVTGAVRVALYSNLPDPANVTMGEPDSELVYIEKLAVDVGTSLAWETFTFASPYDVADQTTYWIVLTSDNTEGGYYYVEGTAGGGVTMLFATNGSWVPSENEYFYYRVHYASWLYGQSFTAPAAGVTCTNISVYGVLLWTDPITFKLCQNNAGVPGTVLQTKVYTPTQGTMYQYDWIQVTWDSGEALTGSTVYWITVEFASEGFDAMMGWKGDVDGEYASGASVYKVGSGSWTARTGDLFFRVNTPGELDGKPVGFVRYSGSWYCAAGDTVYVWNEGGLTWDIDDAQAGENITDIEVWGGKIWVARGTNIVRVYDGSWADDGTNTAQLFKGGGGYLHRTDPTTVNQLYYTSDGSTWSSAIVVGSSDFAITGMEWFRDMLVVATSQRLWGIAAEMAYPLLEWASQENADNGKNMLYWSKTGALYIPLHYGLYRWNGDTMVAVGPEQGTGLPAGRDGKIAALVGTGNWLYAAVDGGASGKSSVLAYGGRQGWHEMQRSDADGDRIQALGFETVSSPSRLWLGLSTGTRYLMLPDTSDNPYQWTGYEFNQGGEIITSWIGGELLEVVKDLHQVVIRAEDLSATQTVDIYYEVDRSGRWTKLGQVTGSPRSVLDFASSSFYVKTLTSDSTRTTIELASGSVTTDMNPGDWVRFSETGEVAQVALVDETDVFELETALVAAPASGGKVYASGPAGREFRLKLVLASTSLSGTPKIQAVFVRYQNNVLDRFMYSLNVRVEDGLRDLAGNPYPHTAKDLRVALDGWAQRARAFTMYDPDGVSKTVKVTSVGEGGWKRRQKEGQKVKYGSTYSMNLVEVA